MYKIVIYKDDKLQNEFEGDAIIYSVASPNDSQCHCAALVDGQASEVLVAYVGARKVLQSIETSCPVIPMIEDTISETLDRLQEVQDEGDSKAS